MKDTGKETGGGVMFGVGGMETGTKGQCSMKFSEKSLRLPFSGAKRSLWGFEFSKRWALEGTNVGPFI